MKPKKPSPSWFYSDLKKVPSNGIKVMSTFSCGGGSTMGYKLAGCEVIAANDIDKEMQWHYLANHKPKHYFLCPIKDLLKMDLPPEIFDLDILDGSPPCSTFSMSGKREKDWGKEKHFREGQAKQKLSDLFFDFLDVAEHLKPKVIIAENVKGMIIGNAKGYCKLVLARLKEMGYQPQLFLINAANCGVPQNRERVFFCAIRNDLYTKPLKLAPAIPRLTVGEACADVQDLTDEEKTQTKPTGTGLLYWPKCKKGENFAKHCKEITGKASYFSWSRLDDRKQAPTITAVWNTKMHWNECRIVTLRELVRLFSYPEDYIFKNYRIGGYLMGMSVPPRMAEQVARAVCEQWLGVGYDAER